MGKGDKRSRRGKISVGSHGKTRPKRKKVVIIPEAKAKRVAPPKEKPAPKVRKKEAAPAETVADTATSTENPVAAGSEAATPDEPAAAESDTTQDAEPAEAEK
ncbi:MAG: 30S ribosomal protein THX [Acidobacteriota bacterium]